MDLLTTEWVKRIIDELETNVFEQRYTPYEPVTADEWIQLNAFTMEYLYTYMFGNDDIIRILSSETL